MNVRRRTAAAAHWPPATTYLTVTTVPVRQATPGMELPVQVIIHLVKRNDVIKFVSSVTMIQILGYQK